MPTVVVDCDPGWDDALALILLLTGHGPDVAGVTTVFGNDTVERTTDNARRMTAWAQKPEVYVHRGYPWSMSPEPGPPSPALRSRVLEKLTDMGPLGQEDVVDFITDAAVSHGRGLTVLATGPLTNIARTIIEGDLREIGTLVVVGGALKAGNVMGGEFNFSADPVAANTIMQAELNTVIIPLETCERLPITSDFLEGCAGTRAADLTAAIINDQVKQGNSDALKSFYDGIGALYLLDPTLFVLKQHKARVETSGPSTGALVLDGEQGWPVSIAESIVDVKGAYVKINDTLQQ